MQHQVTITNTGEVFRCAPDMHLLAAMEQACCRGIPVGCRNGGCGACKISIASGRYGTRKMNRAVASAAEEAQGHVLACKTYPQGDMAVTALGRVWQAAKPATNASFSFGFAKTAPISQPESPPGRPQATTPPWGADAAGVLGAQTKET
jgi:ferredoxin